MCSKCIPTLLPFDMQTMLISTQRAQELIAVDQSPAALTILHEHVTSKRSRNSPITSLEPVMLQFVELCVDLKKGKLAKDGLYQYKNTAQNTNVGTIEVRRSPLQCLAALLIFLSPARLEKIHTACRSQSHRCTGKGRANTIYAGAWVCRCECRRPRSHRDARIRPAVNCFR